MISYGESDNGRAIQLAGGQQFAVELSTQPGTGYDWAVANDVPSFLRLVTSEIMDAGRPVMPGAQQQRRFVFEAVGTGQSKLTIVYRRSWEKNKPPTRAFTLAISSISSIWEDMP